MREELLTDKSTPTNSRFEIRKNPLMIAAVYGALLDGTNLHIDAMMGKTVMVAAAVVCTTPAEATTTGSVSCGEGGHDGDEETGSTISCSSPSSLLRRSLLRQLQGTKHRGPATTGSVFLESLIFFALMLAFAVLIWVIFRCWYVAVQLRVRNWIENGVVCRCSHASVYRAFCCIGKILDNGS